MAEQLRVVSRTDFAGGLQSAASPYKVAANAVLRMNNLMLSEDGSLATRDGARSSDQAPAGTTAVLSLYDFVNTAGTVFHLAITRTASTQLLARRNTGMPWPTLGSFTTRFDIPTLNTFRNLAIIAAGYEPIRSFDGTTFTSLVGGPLPGAIAPPGAKHIAVHRGSLWAWNTAAVTNATDGPSSLRQSSVDNPNSWPVENQTFLSNDDGQQGQGLGVFTVADTGISPQGVLIAFKDFSTYIVTGGFAETNFIIDKAKTDLGCVAPRSIQFIAGLGIMRLTHRGFSAFDGTGERLVSEPIRPYLFAQRVFADITPIAWEHIGLATATQVQNPPLYICACATGPGPALNRVFVYDLLRQAWTILTFPVPFATLDAQYDPGVEPYVLAGEQGGGRVQQLFTQASNDDGVDIPWSVRLQPLTAGSPSQRLYVRRMLLTCIGLRRGQRITSKSVFGPDAQQVGPLVHVSAPSADSVLADPDLAGGVDSILQFDIGRTGSPFYHELAGEGQMTLREISLHARSKSPSRPMRI